MPLPPVNLSNVNIQISQFQDVSSGEINAGEIKLTGETSIDKVNNHVRQRGKNKVSQTLAEVLAVKHAFLRALSGSGVGAEELARIRRDLGLEPRQPSDKDLRARSMKPLTRQQVREILDRNANAINAVKGAGTIRTSAELNAGVSTRVLADRRASRESVNAELNSKRSIEQNRDIAAFQRVIAGDVDFRPAASTAKLLETFRRMAEDVAEEAMERFGEKGFAGGGDFTVLTARLVKLAPAGSPRLTPDSLRPIYRENAIEIAAFNFLLKEIEERMAAAGQDPNDAITVANSLRKRTQEVMTRLCAARSPQEAHDVVNDFADLIADTARRHLVAMRCHARLDGWAREKLAAKLGVPVATLAARFNAGEPPERIYETMTEISKAARVAADANFAADRARGKEIGPDETHSAGDIFIRIAVLSLPGLDRQVGDFLEAEIQRGELFNDPHKPQHGAVVFMPFRPQDA